MLANDESARRPSSTRRAEIVLVAEPTSARRARRFVRDVLRPVRHSIPLDSVLLVVSELVTNAVCHGAGAPTLVVDARPDRVRVEVRDRAPMRPARPARTEDEERGRGLMIVAAVADDWAVEPAGEGKVVWAELACAS